MWFNILPAYFIIFGSLALPGYGLWAIHWLVLGNHYRRSLLDRWERHTYQRDMRLTGNPYNVARLVDVTGDRRAGDFLAQRISIAIQRGNAASIIGTMPQGPSGLEAIPDK